MIRNLLYNCCAPQWSREWRPNIEKLCSYPDAFNGRKVVIVRTGPDMADPAEVEATFSLDGVEFVHLPNDPDLGEVSGFIDTLSMLESTRHNEATFYAHTKGAGYNGVLERRMQAVRQWRNAMYEGCLSDIDRIEKELVDHACAGCMKQAAEYVGRGAGAQARAASMIMPGIRWHFAGTFWWVKHSALFSHPGWRTVPDYGRYGVEAYPGSLFESQDAAALNETPLIGMYSNLGMYRCANCANLFEFREDRTTGHPLKTCPKCHKRQGRYIGSPGADLVARPMRSCAQAVFLHEMASEILKPGASIAELGCYYGESTVALSEYAGVVYAIDPWEEDYLQTPDVADAHRERWETMADVEARFDLLTHPHSSIHKIKARHQDAVTRFPDASLDMVYCDAVHSEADTGEAIDLWTPKVVPGGVVAGHDYGPEFPGVIAAVDKRSNDSFKLWGDGNWAFRPK